MTLTNRISERDFFEKRLQTLERLFLAKMISKFGRKVNAARDKNLVLKEELKSFIIQLFFCFEKDIYVKMLISDFWNDYSRGHVIDDLIIRKSTELLEAFNEGIELPETIKKFKNPFRLINFYSKYVAFYKFNQIYKKEYPEIFDELELKLKIKKPVTRTKNKYYYDPKHAHLFESNIEIDNNPNINLTDISDIEIIQESDQPISSNNRRQTITILYLFEELKMKNIDAVKKARFISMLTGKSPETTRQLLSKLMIKSDNGQLKDLEFILPFFQDLELKSIENKILGEIKRLEKDIENQITKNL